MSTDCIIWEWFHFSRGNFFASWNIRLFLKVTYSMNVDKYSSNWVDFVNWPPSRVSKLMFQVLALHQSKRGKANTWNISFQTLDGGQFMLSTQWIILNYLGVLSYQCNTLPPLFMYEWIIFNIWMSHWYSAIHLWLYHTCVAKMVRNFISCRC